MSLSSAFVCCLFIPLFDGKTVLPEPATMRIRMLFLEPGMDQNQVEAVLRLRKRFPTTTAFTLRWSSEEYAIGPNPSLQLEYQYDFGRDKWVLEFVELNRGKKQVARVPAAKPDDKKSSNALKKIDPALIEDAIRAIHGRRSPRRNDRR